MDGRGGCCIARYAGGHAAAYDMSKMDRIMLKFRPIAPKPTAASEAAVTTSSDGGGKAASGGRGRKKGGGSKDGCNSGSSSGGGSTSSRRSNNNNNGRKRKSCSPPDPTAEIVPDQGRGVVTLPLLPEAPDLSPTKASADQNKKPIWVTQAQPQAQTQAQMGGSEGGVVVGSCVVVEGITDTWMGAMRNNTWKGLEEDTCPGFVSDAWNRVWWTNDAYRRMVMGEDAWRDLKMVVWVTMREKIPETLQAFTCRVRVQQSYDGKECRGSALTVPCDVWRIDGGGFAWRLDVEAALSLGLGR